MAELIFYADYHGDGQFRKICMYLILRFYSNRENWKKMGACEIYMFYSNFS